MDQPVYSISFSGRVFQSCYAAYIVRVTYKGQPGYYVGYTSDNVRVNAMPIVQRLIRHMEKSPSSKTNILYQLIARWVVSSLEGRMRLTTTMQQTMESALADMKFTCFVYPLREFSFLDQDIVQHRKRVAEMKEFAAKTMHWLNDSGYDLLNTQMLSIRHPHSKKFLDQFQQMKNDISSHA